MSPAQKCDILALGNFVYEKNQEKTLKLILFAVFSNSMNACSFELPKIISKQTYFSLIVSNWFSFSDNIHRLLYRLWHHKSKFNW